MELIISNACGQPIYEQIYRQIRDAILAGELGEGELLPSIRQLAKDLRISVITTKRAYDELEKDGYIDTVAARGCFVAKQNTELLRETRLREIEEHLRELVRLAASCGLSDGELDAMLHVIREEDCL